MTVSLCLSSQSKVEMDDGLGNVAEALTLNSWLADAIRGAYQFYENHGFEKLTIGFCLFL